MRSNRKESNRIKIVLAAVNASFVHSNPAVYALRRSAELFMENSSATEEAHICPENMTRKMPTLPDIEIAEFTINDRYEDILFDLIGRGADVIGLSVYIWNAQICRQLLYDLRRVHGERGIILFAGGPEAATHAEEYLESCDFVMTGEGEAGFSEFCRRAAGLMSEETCTFQKPDAQKTSGRNPTDTSLWQGLPGTVYYENGTLRRIPPDASAASVDKLPFLYDGGENFEHRIVYYETSRGCPFRCTYCLSSIDAPVRFRDLAEVRKELQYFLDRQVSLVKFVDRTFNANGARAREIWTYIKEHDNGITGFHFEIGADLLKEEDLSLLKTLRPGLIQLEIGIQSTNPETLAAIRRNADNRKIFRAVRELLAPQNMALHTDLIAGLPYENLASFAHSFNEVYSLRAHQFQLGFLKVLAGTEMARKAEEYGIISSARPPYTVLATKWVTPEEIDLLRGIADLVELFWNSGLFRHALPHLEQMFESPFDMYRKMAAYYKETMGRKALSPRARGAFLLEFAQQEASDPAVLRELIRFDEALHFHPSRRMRAEETFRLPEKLWEELSAETGESGENGNEERKILIDYSKIHPVTKEAAWQFTE